MVSRMRSNISTTSIASKADNAPAREVATADTTGSQVDIDFADTALPALEEEQTSMPAAPAEEYVEDILDYDDDDLAPADITAIPHSTNDVDTIPEQDTALSAPTERTAEQQPATTQAMADMRLLQAKMGVAWSAETMLTLTPDLPSALQLHTIDDAVTVQVSAHGVSYDVTWRIAGFYEPEAAAPAPDAGPNASLHTTAPLFSTSIVKCKFMRHCHKGSSCTFEHTKKPKLCTWVNTQKGCMKGARCEFSHENEDAKCTRSQVRSECANGRDVHLNMRMTSW
jgi:hypothetical protein